MPEGPLSGRRVLIVEDEYFLADELDRTLRRAGAVVLGPVASVEAALDLLARETADAASIDVNLGGTMAYPVADALRARGVPFLFTTGYDRAVLPERYADAPRLEKPVETEEVLRALGRLPKRCATGSAAACRGGAAGRADSPSRSAAGYRGNGSSRC